MVLYRQCLLLSCPTLIAPSQNKHIMDLSNQFILCASFVLLLEILFKTGIFLTDDYTCVYDCIFGKVLDYGEPPPLSPSFLKSPISDSLASPITRE